jgi:hypothetical protein
VNQNPWFRVELRARGDRAVTTAITGKTDPADVVSDIFIWESNMSVGTIILIILVIVLLGGFSGLGGGPFYGTGYYGGGGLGLVIVILLILVLLGRL